LRHPREREERVLGRLSELLRQERASGVQLGLLGCVATHQRAPVDRAPYPTSSSAPTATAICRPLRQGDDPRRDPIDRGEIMPV
jgi:hypothetical protein